MRHIALLKEVSLELRILIVSCLTAHDLEEVCWRGILAIMLSS
jgi:hypothetical protein